MKKVLIISDSHGLTDEIAKIKERHHVQYMIHCGDSELNYNDSLLEEMIRVAGNCDHDRQFSYDQTIEIEGLIFFVTHGHLYNVHANLLELAYKATEKNAHVVCYGHTHIAHAENVRNQLFINPGSIKSSRNRMEESYVILEWEELDKIQVNFYSITGEIIHELSYETSLLNY